MERSEEMGARRARANSAAWLVLLAAVCSVASATPAFAAVTFTPTGGSPNAQDKSIKLKRKRK